MKPAGPVLRKSEYRVEPVAFSTCVELVTAYHYARGGPNTATYRHGLFHVEDPMTCLGVAWWLPPTRVAAETVHPDWRRVLSLSRLVIVPGMPTNAASFLLAGSVRLIRADGRFVGLVTYADEGQGHTGAIYRAANWEYIGTRPGDPVYKDADGRQVARKSAKVSRTDAQMRELGYTNTGRTRKHKFRLALDGSAAPTQQENAA